jgi:hypothetical protein
MILPHCKMLLPHLLYVAILVSTTVQGQQTINVFQREPRQMGRKTIPPSPAPSYRASSSPSTMIPSSQPSLPPAVDLTKLLNFRIKTDPDSPPNLLPVLTLFLEAAMGIQTVMLQQPTNETSLISVSTTDEVDQSETLKVLERTALNDTNILSNFLTTYGITLLYIEIVEPNPPSSATTAANPQEERSSSSSSSAGNRSKLALIVGLTITMLIACCVVVGAVVFVLPWLRQHRAKQRSWRYTIEKERRWLQKQGVSTRTAALQPMYQQNNQPPTIEEIE